MRFYVFNPTFYLRPKNTDWLYNLSLPQIKDYTDGLEIYVQQAFLPSLITNIRLAANIASYRYKVPFPQFVMPTYEARFSLSDLKRSKADVIFGHSPTNVHHLPLICHTGPLHEQAMLAKGILQAKIEVEKLQKIKTIRRSHLVTLNSEAGAESLRVLDPASAEKIRSIPFFLPHLKSISADQLEEKYRNPQKINLLFVGREARRKGLPAVLAAFQVANALYPNRLDLRIVTNFADGPIDVPSMPNLHLQGQASRDEVAAMMRESHMLLMPSLYETYGWVYLEAMAAGAIAMAPNAPTQQEILANGDAGILVTPTAEAVTAALLGILARPEAMLPLARRGWQRIKDVYDPHSVANQMKALGWEAKERFAAGKR